MRFDQHKVWNENNEVETRSAIPCMTYLFQCYLSVWGAPTKPVQDLRDSELYKLKSLWRTK